jgi:hypothetical protein
MAAKIGHTVGDQSPCFPVSLLQALSIPDLSGRKQYKNRVDTAQLHLFFLSIVKLGENPFRNKVFLNNLRTPPPRRASPFAGLKYS